MAGKPTLEHKIAQVQALIPLLTRVFPRRRIFATARRILEGQEQSLFYD